MLRKVVGLCKARTDLWGAQEGQVAGYPPEDFSVIRIVMQVLLAMKAIRDRMDDLHAEGMKKLAQTGVDMLSPSDRAALIGKAGEKRGRPQGLVDLCDDDDDDEEDGANAAAAGGGGRGD